MYIVVEVEIQNIHAAGRLSFENFKITEYSEIFHMYIPMF